MVTECEAVRCGHAYNYVPKTQCLTCPRFEGEFFSPSNIVIHHGIKCHRSSGLAIKKVYLKPSCDYCGRIFNSFTQAESQEKYCKIKRIKEEQQRLKMAQVNKSKLIIEKLNSELLKSESGKLTTQDEMRFYFTIYRLYRYYDVNLKQLSRWTYASEAKVQKIIGVVFAYLCTKDKACPFKDFLKQKKECR